MFTWFKIQNTYIGICTCTYVYILISPFLYRGRQTYMCFSACTLFTSIPFGIQCVSVNELPLSLLRLHCMNVL